MFIYCAEGNMIGKNKKRYRSQKLFSLMDLVGFEDINYPILRRFIKYSEKARSRGSSVFNVT